MNGIDDDDLSGAGLPEPRPRRTEGRDSTSQRPRDARRRLEELLEEKRLRAQIRDYLSEEEDD